MLSIGLNLLINTHYNFFYALGTYFVKNLPLGRFLEDFGKKNFTLQAFLVFLTLEMKISTLKLLFRGVLEGAATLCWFFWPIVRGKYGILVEKRP